MTWAPLAIDAAPFYSDGMLVVVWIILLFFLLFLLGSTVGSFLNVCIVRLPQGRSLIRPPSCCGNCGKPIRWQDNIPLLSYWLLRGRCRACGAGFSMRYFWIELTTGLVFVLLYYLEIARNVHHFHVMSWYEDRYESLLMEIFQPRPWLVFGVHALLSSFLIVVTMTQVEQHSVPRVVTAWGVSLGLLCSVLFPWPWPDEPAQAIAPAGATGILWGRENRLDARGPRVGAMPAEAPWWSADITPPSGLYPWPVWGPLPHWLPPGSLQLGLATGLAGILSGAVLSGLFLLAFRVGSGISGGATSETRFCPIIPSPPCGGRGVGVRGASIPQAFSPLTPYPSPPSGGRGGDRGQTLSLLLIAGAFLGWQPLVVAALPSFLLGLLSALRQGKERGRPPVGFHVRLVLVLAGVWLGWYWIGPLVQGVLFHGTRLLLTLVAWTALLFVLSFYLQRAGIARSKPRPSMSQGESTQPPSRELP